MSNSQWITVDSDTLIEGLELVRRGRAYRKAMALKGRLALDVDLHVLRDR